MTARTVLPFKLHYTCVCRAGESRSGLPLMRLSLVDCKLLQFRAEVAHCVSRTGGLGERPLREHACVNASWLQGSLAPFEGIERRLLAGVGTLGEGPEKTGGAAASQLRPNASGLLRAAVSRREQNSLSLRTATATPLSHLFPAPAPICFLTWLTHSRVALLTRTLSLLETGALILPVARPLRVTGVALS